MCLPFRCDDTDLRNDMNLFQSIATSLVAFIAVAACSPAISDSPALTGSPTGADASSPTEASAPAPGSTEGGAMAAYRGMWQAFAEAGATGDWTSPDLANYATGEALSLLTRGIKAQHDRGWVSRGEPVLSPSVKAATPPSAPKEVLITDCGDSTNWIRYEAVSGRPVADDPRGRRHIEAIVTQQSDGAWRVVKFAVQEIGTC
ncbi:hypothetical protein [Saccharothrix variisporea]|uniref:Mce-associated membrane protein n=1 Tax=Saccharothrix variisporea TaxID=543527 RepID=A0A495X650_9PSEU|nr:hypothetical protein [Saccharothrix variisporea]RKT69472.1 hypothetical protein DFJ66_2702 [Saccharothrix variisporea]